MQKRENRRVLVCACVRKRECEREKERERGMANEKYNEYILRKIAAEVRLVKRRERERVNEREREIGRDSSVCGRERNVGRGF